MAALVSITLLSRLFTDSSPMPRRLPDCFPRYFLHLCYDWSLCLTQLTPAYGVTSICRFVQAATALSITQSFFARMPLLSLWLLAFLFFGFLHSLLPPSRHYASACPHVNRHHSPALHPVFQQLVPTAEVYYYTPLSVGGSQVRTPVGVCGR